MQIRKYYTYTKFNPYNKNYIKYKEITSTTKKRKETSTTLHPKGRKVDKRMKTKMSTSSRARFSSYSTSASQNDIG
jgi:hypothetical protein